MGFHTGQPYYIVLKTLDFFKSFSSLFGNKTRFVKILPKFAKQFANTYCNMSADMKTILVFGSLQVFAAYISLDDVGFDM